MIDASFVIGVGSTMDSKMPLKHIILSVNRFQYKVHLEEQHGSWDSFPFEVREYPSRYYHQEIGTALIRRIAVDAISFLKIQ